MIHRLKYFHGTGYRSQERLPKNLQVAVSVGSSSITEKIVESYEKERIAELSGTHGDRTAGNPVEIDQLEVEDGEGERVVVTVLNRGIALLLTPPEEGF